MLDFLWRQWSALGVAGGARAEETWVIDPEALLIFSLSVARYEPRLFDEILDWLVANAQWMDMQRLRGILRTKDPTTQRLVSAVAGFVAQEARTYSRKWRAIGALNRTGTEAEMLFLTKDGERYPKPQKASTVFRNYGFIREEFEIRRMSKPVIGNTRSNFRFLLRALFGIGSRSECILYLLTHEAGHPNEVAKAIGISAPAVRDTLVELAESALVLTRKKGKRTIEYWLSQKKWWQFLSGMDYEDVKKPIWLNWISLFSALNNAWEVLNEAQKAKSDYLRSSKLRSAMETISHEFAESKIDLPAMPGLEVPPEKYEQAFQNFIVRVLGA